MALQNSQSRYGSVTKVFHWLTALLIFTVIPLGVIAHGWPFETPEELARKALLFSMHKTVGVTIFFVALARICWAISQPKPGLLNADNRPEALAAETVHWLLYGSLLLVPLTGWIHHAATTGFAPIWWPFGQSLPFVPKDDGVAAVFRGLHMVLERVLLVSFLLHIAGALKHHFIDGDATLRRMLPGRPDLPDLPAQHASRAPLGLALVVWASALGIGSAIGAYAPHGPAAPQAEALEDVASQWQVQSGEIAIEVTQFGSAVPGQFEDWTAAITFDEKADPRDMGDVDVTISIASLTLGSVTAQAMGPDYFDATQFPTARFKATIKQVIDGYAAEGVLSIKGRDVPLTLPFSLRLEGDQADVDATITLDRRDFGVGDNMADEATLKFGVALNIALVAQRANAP